MKWMYFFGLIMGVINAAFIASDLHSAIGWLTSSGFSLLAYLSESKLDKLKK